MSKIILFTMMTTLVFSCSTRTCKPSETLAQNSETKKLIAGETKISPTNHMSNNQIKKIKIYKPDGSIQCEKGTGIPVQEMAKELGDITIYNSENKHDGLMRIQVCGQPTGQSNVYEIGESDYPRAAGLGFKKWKGN